MRQADHRIGCWIQDGSRLIRTRTNEPLHFWAAVDELELVSQQQRIVLIGESTARGYLYDPEFTPAAGLTLLLEKCTGHRVQVIDLARTNATLIEVLSLMRSAVVLEPRVIVLWAGNNWFLAEDFKATSVVSLLRAGANAHCLRTHLQELHRQRVKEVVDQMAEIVHGIGARGIVVIPDFNLLGWKDALSEPPPIAREERRRWAAVRKRLLAAQSEANWAAVEACAERLTAIDGGLAALGLVAKAELCRLQQPAHARALLEAARDAELWPKSPRCHGVTAAVLYDHATARGLSVVDLSQKFIEWRGDTVPSPDLFLDYCHHSHIGLRLACAFIAEAILECSFGRSVAWSTLATEIPAVPPQVEAQCQFLAAAHNAAHAQPPETLGYHLDKALEADPGVVTTMRQYIKHRFGHAPHILAGGHDWQPQMERYFGPSGLREGPLDLALTEQILKRVPAGTKDLTELIASHALTHEPRELVLTRYGQPVAMDEAALEGCAYHRRRRSTSEFVIFLTEPTSILLDVSYRTPNADLRSRVKLCLAGRAFAELPAAISWKRTKLTVPASSALAGINVLEFQWPDSTLDGSEILATFADELEAGERPVAPYPVLGEVFSLRANL